MQVSAKGRIEILSHEAIVLTWYLDSANVPTIGAGVTRAAGIDPKEASPITVEQAVSMFAERVLPKYERGVTAALDRYGMTASRNEFDALVSFHYNTGRGARIVEVWAKSGKDAAARKMMEFVRAGGKVSRGLQVRRQKEAAMFLHGQYGTGTVRVYDANSKGTINWKSGRVVAVSHLMPPEPTPAPVAFMPPEAEELIEDSDKGFLESNTDKANMIASAGGLSGLGGMFAYVQDWRVQIALIFALLLVAGAAFYIFASRRRKAKLARKARVA